MIDLITWRTGKYTERLNLDAETRLTIEGFLDRYEEKVLRIMLEHRGFSKAAIEEIMHGA